MVIPGDSEDLRALPRYMGADCEVQLLDDANSALWEVRSAPPDVILANVELPGMSGLDLAEILPNFGLATRVVLWSQAQNEQAAQQAAGFGVHRFVTAPVTPDDLRSMLQDELREAQAAAHTTPAEPEPEPEAPAPEAPAPAPAPERQRRMHDVPPAPPPTERQRRMHDVSPAQAERPRRGEGGTSSLADRARRAAQETPAEHHPARPTQTRQGALVLTADSLKPIHSRMEALEREVGSQCIMLADRAGMLLAEVGLTAGLPTMILLPLLSTSFSTAGQISQMLREKESSALYMHEGANYDVYCFDVLSASCW
jgi:CheY-like chemotaxis protein